MEGLGRVPAGEIRVRWDKWRGIPTSVRPESPKAFFSASLRRSFSAPVSLKECLTFSNSLLATALFTALRVRLLKLAVCLLPWRNAVKFGE